MKKVFLMMVVVVAYLPGYAQNEIPYKEDVEVIKKFDSMFPQPKHPIVFTGSSSIRLWIDFNKKFGRYNAINRGIGGAQVKDIIYHANELIFAYAPSKIVLYIGENDLPDETTTADSVLNRTRRLFTLIRANLPSVPIVYIAMKPSPSRDQFQAKAREGNAKIRAFLEGEQNATFLDIYSPMLTAGKSRPELFLDDRLHMNEKGYALWEKKLIRHLRK